jgi:hypothetical protein
MFTYVAKQKKITDFNCSPESQTVSQKPKSKKPRMFTIDGKKKFFTKHIKSLLPPLRVFADTRSSRHTQMGVCFPRPLR